MAGGGGVVRWCAVVWRSVRMAAEFRICWGGVGVVRKCSFSVCLALVVCSVLCQSLLIGVWVVLFEFVLRSLLGLACVVGVEFGGGRSFVEVVVVGWCFGGRGLVYGMVGFEGRGWGRGGGPWGGRLGGVGGGHWRGWDVGGSAWVSFVLGSVGVSLEVGVGGQVEREVRRIIWAEWVGSSFVLFIFHVFCLWDLFVLLGVGSVFVLFEHTSGIGLVRESFVVC